MIAIMIVGIVVHMILILLSVQLVPISAKLVKEIKIIAYLAKILGKTMLQVVDLKRTSSM